MSVDLQETVTNESSVASAWKALKDRFDRETPSTTITLLKAVITNTLSETGSIPNHIVSFEAAWNRLNHRTASNQDTNALHKALHPLTASVEAKVAFLLMSLPPSMQTEVDILQARQALTYEDVQDLLQHKATDRETRNPDTGNKAFKTTGSGKEKEKECTWCKARKEKVFTGHTYNECQKLKAHQEKKRKEREGKSSTPGPSTQVAQVTAAHVSDMSMHDDATVIAMVRANHTLCPKHASEAPLWITDSGATAHTTPRKEDFTELLPHQSLVQTADGTIHPVVGRGTVTLECSLPVTDVTGRADRGTRQTCKRGQEQD